MVSWDFVLNFFTERARICPIWHNRAEVPKHTADALDYFIAYIFKIEEHLSSRSADYNGTILVKTKWNLILVYFNVIYVMKDPLPLADSVVLLVELINQFCDRGKGVDR